jgi:hypothetical protein
MMGGDGKLMIWIDEITPEKIRELTDERDENKEINHNRLATERLQQSLKAARREVEFLEAKSKLRAKSLSKDGMSVIKIAEWLDESEATINDWLQSPLEVVLTKSASDLVREYYEVR